LVVALIVVVVAVADVVVTVELVVVAVVEVAEAVVVVNVDVVTMAVVVVGDAPDTDTCAPWRTWNGGGPRPGPPPGTPGGDKCHKVVRALVTAWVTAVMVVAAAAVVETTSGPFVELCAREAVPGRGKPCGAADRGAAWPLSTGRRNAVLEHRLREKPQQKSRLPSLQTVAHVSLPSAQL